MAAVRLGLIGLVLCVAFALMLAVQPMVAALKTVDVALPAAEAVEELAAVYDIEEAQLLQSVVIDPAYTHAPQEHPDTYESVRSCLDRNGPYVTFQVAPHSRWLRVCLIDEQTVGFQIVDKVGKNIKERTAYVKDTIHSLRELFDYARKMGYARFTKPL